MANLLPLLLLLLCFPAAVALAEHTCSLPAELAAHAGKEVRLCAHVYSVAEEADGTRYLNLCPPDGTGCRVTVVSLPEDREDVGPLEGLAATDVEVRGVVHSAGAETFLVLSNKRQLHGGPEKFRPNPALLAGFEGQHNGMAFRDPALSMKRRHGASSFAGSSAAK